MGVSPMESILFLFGHDAAHHSFGACVKSNCPFDVLNLAILLDFLSSFYGSL